MNTLTLLRRWLHRGLGLLLALASLWLGLHGAQYYIATAGEVSGSEFGLLIILVNSLGALMLWVMLFGLWRISAPRRAATADLIDLT